MNLITLLQVGLLTLMLDIDNALYLTAAVDGLSPAEQRRTIWTSVLLETVGRFLLIVLILSVIGRNNLSIQIGNWHISIESIALVGAGLFVLMRSLRELVSFFTNRAESVEEVELIHTSSFLQRLVEITAVCLTLSIDTIVAITGATSSWGMILYLLLFSAIIRLVFVQQLAGFIERHPAINVIALTFLCLIGAELLLQGLGLSFPEEAFNFLLMLAMITAVLLERRQNRLQQFLKKMR